MRLQGSLAGFQRFGYTPSAPADLSTPERLLATSCLPTRSGPPAAPQSAGPSRHQHPAAVRVLESRGTCRGKHHGLQEHPQERQPRDWAQAPEAGGSGQSGHVKITLEPQRVRQGYEFVNPSWAALFPKEYILAIDAGTQGRYAGGRAGRLSRGGCEGHAVRWFLPRGGLSEMAFKIAGPMAFKEAYCVKMDPALLEPPYHEGVRSYPTSIAGDVIGDLNARRGQIQLCYEMRAGAQQIDAFVPCPRCSAIPTCAPAPRPWSVHHGT